MTTSQGALATSPLPERPSVRSQTNNSQLGDLLLRLICFAAASIIILLFAGLLGILVWQSWESITVNGVSFFTTSKWDPEDSPTHRKFGALAFIWGTIATSVIAMLLAVPLGVGTAAFLAEIAPRWLRKSGAFMVEMLAAIPSVVYGFWGMYVAAPFIQSLITAFGGPNIGGRGLLTAGIVLAIMIVPYVAAVSYDVIRAVPRSQREGSLALGATRWQMIRSVVLPFARPGIVGGCFLALGRALGETMAVTMLIGNRPDIPNFLGPISETLHQIVFGKGNSIPSVIANEFTEATYDLYLSALVQLGLLLMLVSVGFSALGRLLIWQVNRPGSRSRILGMRMPFARKPKLLDSGAKMDRMAPSAPSGKSEKTDGRTSSQTNLPGTARNSKSASLINKLMTGVLCFCVIATCVPLVLIVSYLLYRGGTSLNWDFFTKTPATVGEAGGGMAHALFGSAMMIAMATAFSVPIGLLAAIYLSEYKTKRFGAVVRFIAEMLGSVPSIVIGIFGYYVVVKGVTGHFSGYAGAFALGVMMIPIVVRACEEALKVVPKSIRDASYALGATKWQTIVRITVPAAFPSIITAVFLSIARVAGETAPLILTAFGNNYWPRSLNDSYPSMPQFIFNYAISAYDDWKRQAWAAAFVLVAAIMVLNFGIRLITGKRALLASRAD
jgi:phosphate transport system permease protein